MSKTVDERVVSMRFDNSQFETNVRTSMSTLDKLKQSLNFKGASKGLDNLNSSVKNVNMSPLSQGIEAVRIKFSALEIMGVTALANITNSAVNAGKRIMSALTIEPVKTGLQEYETQINAVQTILANTKSKGSTLDDVNKALDELNEYADLTIYNFTEMTRNIGTFTAAGVDLETSVSAIQGIANLAAVSGSTSQQASVAMYQLSQALAAGTVKLMDWNSVVNAGMGGEIFQNALKETSKALGTGAEAAIKANGSFRESLTVGWLTSEVLTETLKKFTTSGANEYVAEYTGLSVEAVKAALDSAEAQYGEADAIEYASKALAKQSGKSEKAIRETLEFAKTAEDAATKVKTFSQMWDVLKETAQSGWSRTWKLIFGDFEEAKSLFTPLTDFFTNVIQKVSDFRNNLLEGALKNPFTAMLDKLNDSGIGKVAEKIGNVTKSLEHYQELVTNIWRGDWDNGVPRKELLEKAGYNYKVVQDLVNKGLEYKITTDDIAASEKKFGQSISKVSETAKETTATYEGLNYAQLINAGLTRDEIQMYKDLEKQSKKTGKSIQELVKEMGEKDGRTLLIESFKNAGKGIAEVAKTIKNAWLEIFPAPTVVQLYNIIKGLNEFSQNLIMGRDTAGKLKSTLKGLFAIIDIIAKVVGGALKTAFKIIGKLFGTASSKVLDLTGNAGDAIVAFHDWIIEGDYIAKTFDKVLEVVGKVIEKVKGWIAAFKEIPGVQKVLDKIKGAFSSVGDAVKNMDETIEKVKAWIAAFKELPAVQKIIERFKEGFTGFKEIGGNIIAELKVGLQDGISKAIEWIINLGKGIIEAIKNVLGIHSPSTEFQEIGENTIAGFVKGIQNGASTAWEAIKKFGAKCIEVIKGIDFGAVLLTAFAGGILLVIIKIANAMEKIASPLESLGGMFTNIGDGFKQMCTDFGKAAKMKAASKILRNVALAIGVLAASILVLTLLAKNDAGSMWQAFGMIAALALVIGGLTYAVGKIDPESLPTISKTLSSISAAILILSIVAKKLGSMSWDQLGVAGAAMGGLTVLVGVLAVIGSKYGDKLDKVDKVFFNLAGAFLLLGIALRVLGGISWGCLGIAAVAIVGLTAILGVLVVITNKYGSNLDKVNKVFTNMAMAFLVLGIALRLLGGMTWDQLGIAGAAIGGLTVIVGALAIITGKYGDKLDKANKVFTNLAAAFLLLGIALRLLGGMTWGQLGVAAVGMIALTAVIGCLIKIVDSTKKDAPKIGSTLLAIAGAIAVLSVVLKILGGMTWDQLGVAAVAIAGLTAVVGVLVYITQKASKDAPKIATTLLAIAGAIGILAVITVLLGLCELEHLAKGLVAIAVLGTIISVLLHTAKNAKDALKPLIAIEVVLATLGGVLYLLSKTDSKKALLGAAALSVTLLALAGALAIIGKFGGGAAAGAGLLLAAVGILAISAAMMALSLIPADKIGQSILLLVVALAALCGVAALFSVFAAGAGLMVGVLLSLAAVVVSVGIAAIAFAGALYIVGLALPLVAEGLVKLITSLAGCANYAGAFLLTAAALAVALALLAVPLILISAGVAVLAVALAVVAVSAILFAGALALLGLALPVIASGIKALMDAVLSCSGQSKEFLETMLAISAGLAVLGLALVVAGAGVIVLGAGLLVVAAALLVVSVAALVFVGALAIVALLLPSIGKGLTMLGEGLSSFINSVASCKGAMDDFNSVMSIFGNSILEILVKVAAGLTILGVGAIVAAAGALILAAGVAVLGVAILFGAACVLTLAAAFMALGEALNVTAAATEAGKNLVLGFAQGIWDSITTVVETIKGFCNGVIDTVKEFLGIHSPSEVMKALGINTGEGFKLGLDEGSSGVEASAESLAQKAKDGMANAASEGGTSFKTGLGDNLDLSSLDMGSFDMESLKSKFSSAGSEGGTSFMDSIGSEVDGNKESVTSKFNVLGSDSATAFKEGFTTNLNLSQVDIGSLDTASINGKFSSAGSEGGSSFMTALTDSLKTTELSAALQSMITTVNSFKSKMSKAGKDLGTKIGDGLKSKKTSAKNAAKSLVSAASSAIKTEDQKSKFKSAGKYLGDGLVEGIKAKYQAAYDAGYALGQKAVQGEKDGQRSDSPSKLTIKAGKWLGEGLIVGMRKMTSRVYESGNSLGETATDTISSAVAKIAEFVNSDVDAQPTIRPVLDLTDVTAGANRLNSLFDTNPSVGVLSNVRSVSSMMNRNQNGVNGDIISAIKDLGKTIGSSSGDTYSINGISYDDGSTVSEAVRALTRAVRIEGRT